MRKALPAWRAFFVRTLPFALAALFFTAGAGAPDDPAPTTASAPADLFLRVRHDRTPLRAAPESGGTPVLFAPHDALLTASALDAHGWYRITPPPGVFCYVGAEHVELRDADTGVVAVQSGALRVRAASLVRELDPLQAEVLALLERGAPVRVLGRTGRWLKIAPPPGVALYVAGDAVERVSAARAADLAPPTAAPSSAPASRPTPASAPTRPGPDLSGPWGRQLAALEERLTAHEQQPYIAQNWTPFLAELRPIAAQRAEPMVARLAAAWIDQLAERIRVQSVAREAAESVARADREQAQQRREQAAIARAQAAASQPQFDALGVVQRSFVDPPGSAVRRYRLVDPFSGRLVAYLEFPPSADAPPADWIGRCVGVRGPRRAAPELGADVLTVAAWADLAPPPATAPASAPARQPAAPEVE